MQTIDVNNRIKMSTPPTADSAEINVVSVTKKIYTLFDTGNLFDLVEMVENRKANHNLISHTV